MLPPGVFPKTLLFVGFAAIYNTVQCFVPAWRLTPRIYARKKEEVSALMSRMMGTWTFTSAVIRVYTAYHISNHPLYVVCMWSYVIAAFSFTSEVFYFKTAPITSPGVYPTFFISMISLLYMAYNIEAYTGQPLF